MPQGTPRPRRKLKFHLPYLLTAIAAAVLIFILSAQFFDWTDSPAGTAALIGVAIYAALEGVANLRSILSVEAKTDPPPPNLQTTIHTEGGQVQVVQNPRGPVIQAGQYIAQQTVQLPPIPEEMPEAGGVPGARTGRYIPRGKIEDEVRARLAASGAAAIVGVHAPGGTGKTEMAIRIANEWKGRHSADPLWVDAGEKTPAQIIADMAAGCGVKFDGRESYADQVLKVKGQLKAHPRLVVLDDIRPANAEKLADLLPPAPCAVLVTSRIQNLAGIPAGTTFELDRLTDEQAHALLLAELGEAMVQAEAEAIQALIQRCQHNALALDIAARRIRSLKGLATPVATFTEKLRQRLDELRVEGGGERLDLFAVFDLSYTGLSDENRQRFRWLAAFAPTGFSPEAAAQVWGAPAGEASRTLNLLLNLSLLKPVAGQTERYRLHDLLDDFGAHKLRGHGDEVEAHRAQAEFIVKAFRSNFVPGEANLSFLLSEKDNLRVAGQWAKQHHEAELLAHISTASRNWMYVNFRELWDDWWEWLTTCHKLEVKDPELKANVLKAIGDVQQFRDERDAALKSYSEALALYRATGAKLGEANVLKAIGDVQQFRKETDAALKSYSEALALFKAVGDRLGEANVRSALCRLSLASGDVVAAEKELEAVITLRRASGDLYSEGADYGNFAVALLNRGDKQKAKEYALNARAAFERVGEPLLLQQIDRLIAACEA
jgi:tetratricopeptide (TPR) repeat protein